MIGIPASMLGNTGANPIGKAIGGGGQNQQTTSSGPAITTAQSGGDPSSEGGKTALQQWVNFAPANSMYSPQSGSGPHINPPVSNINYGVVLMSVGAFGVFLLLILTLRK